MDDDPYASLAHGAVLLAERSALSLSPRAEHGLEEASLLKEWLDPAYLRLVELVSSPRCPDLHVEGLRILAHLCRRALQRPLPFQHVIQVAECEFAGVATLCRGEEEARYAHELRNEVVAELIAEGGDESRPERNLALKRAGRNSSRWRKTSSR
jgi:hypothetical protein